MKFTRLFLASLAFGLLFLVSPIRLQVRSQEKPAGSAQYLAYVGTYTTPGDWRGDTASKGIYVFRYDAATGKLISRELAAEAGDPSFVVVHPNGKFLYAANEIGVFEGSKSGSVSAFSIDPKTGKLTLLNKVASAGLGPCHISLDRTAKYVLVANYDSGSVSVHPIGPDGHLLASTAAIQHHGSGPDKARQEGPHAHWIGPSPDNRFVLVADLGLDEVLIYRFDAAHGTLVPNDPAFVRLAPGSGPRHLAFHPSGKFAYVVTEMGADVTALSFDPVKGLLKPLQTISTLPADYAGPKEDAEIAVHPNGRFLYVSNRGHDSIAIFAVNPATGALSPLGRVSTHGKTPRAFVLDPAGKHLLVANQITHTIVAFDIDPATGALSPAAPPVEVQAPTSIAFLPLAPAK